MLQMVLNVERVNDPMWMHKPEPEKTELQRRAEAAQEKNDAAMNALRDELGKPTLSARRGSRRPSLRTLTLTLTLTLTQASPSLTSRCSRRPSLRTIGGTPSR